MVHFAKGLALRFEIKSPCLAYMHVLWHIVHAQFGKRCIKGVSDLLHGTYFYSIQFEACC